MKEKIFVLGYGLITKENYDEIVKLNNFLYNEENIYNCENCVFNIDNKGNNLPCGQQHCHVEVHCNQ